MEDAFVSLEKKVLINVTHLNWCIDLLKRMQDVLATTDTSENKITQIEWLVKQALKVEREDD